jgi:PAS domain S-box-containing protein
MRDMRIGQPRAPIGTAAWYRAIAQLAAVAAAIELGVGIVADTSAHVLTAMFVLVAAVMCLAAASWRDRGGRTGPALLMGGTLLALSIVVAVVFEGAPAATLLPMVAFAFSLPSLGGRAIWAFGWIAVLVGGVSVLTNAEDVLQREAGFGRVSAGVAGVVVEGVIIMIVLIHQRVGLSSLVARYTSIVEQVPMGLFRTTPDGRLLDANQWFVEMLGYPSASQLLETSLSELVVGPSAAAEMLAGDDPGRVRIEEVRLRRYDGTTISARTRIRAVQGEAGQTVWFQGAVQDTSDEREAAARQARLAAAVEQSAESVVITGPTAAILYVNPAFERATGYASEEVIGRNPRFLQSGLHPPEFYRGMWAELTAGRTWQGEVVNRRKDGRLVTEQTTITPVIGTGGELSTYVGVKRDTTVEREAAVNRGRIEALLGERRLVAEALARLGPLETPEATADAITSALVALPGIAGAALISLDGEDAASVLAIDGPPWLPMRARERLPAGWAPYLRQHANAGPWSELGTFGPFPETPDPGAATQSDIRAMAYAPIGEASGLIGILVLATEDPDYARDIIDHIPVLVDFANTARLLLVDSWLVQRELEEVRLRIASALTTESFRPVFQPIVDLATGVAVGYEALTRFDGGLAPDVAFAQAHRVGFGLELESATLRAALAASVQLPDGAWLSLNVSPTMLLAGGLLRDILTVRARPVVLEVTEHDVIDDYGALRDAFVALGADLRLAVDDAGAGVANFSHIVELRPDFVKIDIGLIRGINADLSRQALVVGLLHFARASKRDVIAEGVETAAELATLRALDVRFGQGFLLAKPASAASWAATGLALPGIRKGRPSPPTMPA